MPFQYLVWYKFPTAKKNLQKQDRRITGFLPANEPIWCGLQLATEQVEPIPAHGKAKVSNHDTLYKPKPSTDSIIVTLTFATMNALLAALAE